MTINLQPIIQEFKVENKLALAGIGAVTTALAAVAATAALAITSTFKWAGELDSIQDVMGVSSKEAAALNFVLRKSGTETEKLTKGMVVLEKGLFKVDGTLDTAGEKLLDFGINALDVNGKMKDQATLISEISNKFNSLGSQTEKVNFLTETFGKSGADLIDVFDTLAKEGGIDKVQEKVEKLGLAIDPQKYEDFQRNVEEVKLAFLGMGMTVVDNLMPELRKLTDWWEADGLPMFIDMVKWLGVNTPIAIAGSKRAFEGMGETWKTHINPTLVELIRLWENLSVITEKLSPGVDGLAGKFTLLGATQRVAVGWAAFVNTSFEIVKTLVGGLNNLLEKGIGLWDRYRAASTNSSPNTIAAPSTFGSTLGSSKSGVKGRAVGGSVMPGQAYNINERNKQEIFTPNTTGRIDNKLQVETSFSRSDIILLGKTMARALAPQLQKAM